jgi:hypothetical protein
MDFYDASASSASPGERGSADQLRRMQADEADRRLFALFDEIDTMIEEGRERDLEAGLDPAIAERLDSIAGADDAPYELRELHRRVREGTLTWEEFWLAPQDEPGGHELIHAAMRAEGAELSTLLRAVEDEPPPESGVLGC